MAKLTKNQKLALAKYDKDATYTLADAARIVKTLLHRNSTLQLILMYVLELTREKQTRWLEVLLPCHMEPGKQ